MYYRQLSADIEMKNYMIKPSFVSYDGLTAWDNKTGISLVIFILIFVENCLENYDDIHDFSVCLGT